MSTIVQSCGTLSCSGDIPNQSPSRLTNTRFISAFRIFDFILHFAVRILTFSILPARQGHRTVRLRDRNLHGLRWNCSWQIGSWHRGSCLVGCRSASNNLPTHGARFKVARLPVPEVRQSPSRWRQPPDSLEHRRFKARRADTGHPPIGCRPFRPSVVHTIRDRRFTPPARDVSALRASDELLIRMQEQRFATTYRECIIAIASTSCASSRDLAVY